MMQANIFLSLFIYFIFYCFASTRFRRRAMKWLIVINGKAPAHWGALKESLLDAVFLIFLQKRPEHWLKQII
jgi:hypothetical protein